MNAHIREELDSFVAEDLRKDFDALIDLPDEKFAAMSGQLKSQIQAYFQSPEFEAEMLASLKAHPIDDIQSEIAGINQMLKELDEDNTLTEEKRDFLKTLVSGSMDTILKINDNPREKIKVKIEKLNPNATIPTYAHPTDAGADVYALEDVAIMPHTTELVRTGLKMAIPRGYEIQVRPRSGMSLKTNMRIANAPGTIDSGYRNEVGIIITNIGDEIENINAGDRIAQFIIAPVPMMIFEETTINDETDRGEGGFGSSGS